MINRFIRCCFCWRYHEIDIGSFAGHVICPEAGEMTYHGQPQLRCYQCGMPPRAGRTGPGGKPACRDHAAGPEAIAVGDATVLQLGEADPQEAHQP